MTSFTLRSFARYQSNAKSHLDLLKLHIFPETYLQWFFHWYDGHLAEARLPSHCTSTYLTAMTETEPLSRVLRLASATSKTSSVFSFTFIYLIWFWEWRYPIHLHLVKLGFKALTGEMIESVVIWTIDSRRRSQSPKADAWVGSKTTDFVLAIQLFLISNDDQSHVTSWFHCFTVVSSDLAWWSHVLTRSWRIRCNNCYTNFITYTFINQHWLWCSILTPAAWFTLHEASASQSRLSQDHQ